jgi:quinoprotein glucose dehydrogenase
LQRVRFAALRVSGGSLTRLREAVRIAPDSAQAHLNLGRCLAGGRDRAAHATGAANAWSIISADASRDLVFVPVGSASPDFYGGERLGQNLFANSVVALRASTGQQVWHFQVVHHDLWDYDIPAQPVLFTMHRDGREIPALAQPTKMGFLFVFNRETGEPLFPVEERPVPQGAAPGDTVSPTQPFPTHPPPLYASKLTPDAATPLNAPIPFRKPRRRSSMD